MNDCYLFYGPYKQYIEDRARLQEIGNKFTLYILSWNMCASSEAFKSETIRNMLFQPSNSSYPYDIYVIGTQETVFRKRKWTIYIQKHLGEVYVPLLVKTFFDLHLLIFVRRHLLCLFTDVKEDILVFGWTTFLRTKGSLAASFNVLGTTFLFINSHFIAHESNAKQRIKNYSHTLMRLRMKHISGYGKTMWKNPFRKAIFKGQEKDVTEVYDHIFWFGDFNFRIEDDSKKLIRQKIDERRRIAKESFASILECDQLNQFRQDGHLFRGFSEAKINFPPTYKYDIGTDVYDSSHKNRVPSYTDRIMYKGSLEPIQNMLETTNKLDQSSNSRDYIMENQAENVENTTKVLYYNHINSIKCSDHKPVCAIFEITLAPRLSVPRSMPPVYERFGSVFTKGIKKLHPLWDMVDPYQNNLKLI